MAARALALALCLGSPLVAGAAESALPPHGRAALLRTLEVDGVVDGDVVVVGGDLRLGPRARVEGHAVAIFGSVERAPGAVVTGRLVALGGLAGVGADRFESDGGPRLRLAVWLLTAGGWLLATTLLALLWPGRVRAGTSLAPGLGPRLLVLGLLVVLTLFVALVAALGLGRAVGPPVAAAVAMLFLVIKALGLAIIGGALGDRLLTPLVERSLPATFAVFLGVSVLALARLLPLVGGAAWIAVTIAACGAGTFTLVTARTARLGVPIRPTRAPRS